MATRFLAPPVARRRAAVLLRGRDVRVPLLVLAAALLALVPFATSQPYVLRVMTVIFIYSVVTIGQNVITGYTGMLTLGHAAFFGLGAYTSALVVERWDWPWLGGFAAGAVVAGVVGLVVAVPCLRVQSDFLSLVTIAFGSMFSVVALNWVTLTRGPSGLPGLTRPTIGSFEFSTPRSMYWLAIGLLVIVFAATWRIVGSPIGRAWQALRDDEMGAAAQGIPVARYKTYAFAYGTVLAGMAGSVLGHYLQFVNPTSFSLDVSLQLMLMTIIGGLASLVGSVVGTSIMVLIPEVFRSLVEYQLGVGGLILVVLMVLRPQGLLGRTAFGQSTGLTGPLRVVADLSRRLWRRVTGAADDGPGADR
ncbi:MAG TPA: branched-chain amino acid ABC transporter permease [Cellulomonas sp.]